MRNIDLAITSPPFLFSTASSRNQIKEVMDERKLHEE